jgi:Cu/Ag efflux pump CusA
MLTKVHALRHRKALICGELPISESNSKLGLRLRELQLTVAEYMGFFSLFAVVFMQR